MPYKPTQSHDKHTDPNNNSRSPKNTIQYGLHQKDNKPLHGIAFLLAIPNESLTHITSFLDPLSLFTLARTNRQLYDHINDDNTWHRAFLCQFLDIGPESYVRDGKCLMLRRTQSCWKKEFVLRFNLRMRWEKSRTSSVTHSPLNSTIGSIHLISEHGLLTSSIQYGVVSRSHPLTGKVLRGYLDAAGTFNGLGIGNPNAEFSPDVSACCFASEGGTAKILWGFRNGEVAVTLANRVMGSSRTGGAKFSRCQVAEGHDGMVVDAVWGVGGNVFVSAGTDGRVKLWDGKKVRCLWTSEIQESKLVSNPCTKVAFDAEHGTIAAALNSGDIVIWFGLASLYAVEPNADLTPLRPPDKIVIPAIPTTSTESPYMDQPRELMISMFHNQSGRQLSLLTSRVDDRFFYRFNIELSSHSVVGQIRFGEGYAGAISSVKPFVTQNAGESSFVLVGDQLGCLTVYDWDAPSSVFADEYTISPVKRLDAYEDGSSITSIERNSTILITGSSNGTIRVWDSLTFVLLRSLAAPGLKFQRGEWESVKQVILEREMIVVAVGDRIMTWKAGHVRRGGGKVTVQGGKREKKNNFAKWRQQIELFRDIADSKRDLEQEQKYRQQAYGREKDQLGSLDTLGLNEREALAYVLMLSRDDEENHHHQGHLTPFLTEDKVLPRNVDETSGSSFGTPSPPSSLTLVGPGPLSNADIQLSPRFEAGQITARYSGRPPSMQLKSSASDTVNSMNDGFPVVGSNVSFTSGDGTTYTSQVSVMERPDSSRSAWNMPKKAWSPSGSATPSPKASRPVPWLGNCGNSEHVEPGLSDEGRKETDEDNDLRFAIELSLAEARSRGEDV